MSIRNKNVGRLEVILCFCLVCSCKFHEPSVNIVIQHMLYTRKLTYFQMTLSYAMYGQQNIPFFVITRGYVTHSKL